LRHHQAGQLDLARDFYLKALAAQPDDADALHLLGVLRHQEGNSPEAVGLVSRAIAIKPNNADAYSNLGVALAALGRLEEAVDAYRRAIAIRSDNPALHDNLGNAFRDLGRPAEAAASHREALRLQPDFPDAHHHLGIALRDLGRLAEAEASYREALRLRPDFPAAHNNLGTTLVDLDRPAEAEASYREALRLRPDFPEAHNNLGNVLRHLQRCDEALGSYDEALALKPDYAQAHNNRGTALCDIQRLDEGLAAYDRAIALKPEYAEAHNNRGNALRELLHHDEALASYDRAIALKPDYAEARFAMCMAELPTLYMSESEIGVRRVAYERRLRAFCDAGDRSTDPAHLAKRVGYRQPFYLPYQGYNDRDLQAMYGSFVCRVMAARYPPATPAPPPTARAPVRVGIVSGFFRQHSNWKLPIKGWLSQLDRQQFQIFGYHTATQEDAVTKAAAAMCGRFVQGPLSIERWRAEILADAPHVLIYPEVGMDPVAATLAAQRLAAVQCNSWGHPETSGFPTLDYYLGSDLMEPPNGQDHYTERLVRLPDLSMYCEPIDTPPASVAPQNFGLRSTATVYWCCQSLQKYLPHFDAVFSRIARGVGNCQFAFIEDRIPRITGLFRQRLDRAFGALGLSTDDHCCFLPRLDQHAFVAAAGRCHVFLDSIGWSGCNSTLESLLHDLPIVTTAGPLMRGRHSAAILQMMGVTETIAGSIDDYVSIAIRLALDAPYRLAVKTRISASKHRLYRNRVCISGLEQFLNDVARRNCHPAPAS
jgi:predicted O-linked N-acetylglucosamine transferase (SPINDLY family)